MKWNQITFIRDIQQVRALKHSASVFSLPRLGMRRFPLPCRDAFTALRSLTRGSSPHSTSEGCKPTGGHCWAFKKSSITMGCYWCSMHFNAHVPDKYLPTCYLLELWFIILRHVYLFSQHGSLYHPGSSRKAFILSCFASFFHSSNLAEPWLHPFGLVSREKLNTTSWRRCLTWFVSMFWDEFPSAIGVP